MAERAVCLSLVFVVVSVLVVDVDVDVVVVAKLCRGPMRSSRSEFQGQFGEVMGFIEAMKVLLWVRRSVKANEANAY